MGMFHSSGAKIVAQEITSRIRPRHVWITDAPCMDFIPENWDGKTEGELAFQKANAGEIGEWLASEAITPVIAMRDMGLANQATREIGIPVVVNSVVPEFHHGDIWIEVTCRGYYVIKRTS